jgi:hypothetical protein
MKKTLIAALAALTALAGAGVAAAATAKRPVLRSLSYHTIGTGFMAKGEYTAQVRLYTRAPSVELELRGRHGNETDVSVLFPHSYGPGLRTLRVKDISVSPGTYTVSLLINLPNDRHMNGANRATLVVGSTGAGRLAAS